MGGRGLPEEAKIAINNWIEKENSGNHNPTSTNYDHLESITRAPRQQIINYFKPLRRKTKQSPTTPKRKILLPEQTLVLKACKNVPTTDTELESLSSKLDGMTHTAIRQWFRNNRRRTPSKAQSRAQTVAEVLPPPPSSPPPSSSSQPSLVEDAELSLVGTELHSDTELYSDTELGAS